MATSCPTAPHHPYSETASGAAGAYRQARLLCGSERSSTVRDVPSTLDVAKAELIAKCADAASQRKAAGGPPADDIGALLYCYYRHVSAEDVTDRAEMDLYGALASHYKLARDRPQGTAKVRVVTPNVADQGWSADGHSVVEIVTDDMPFLVDSVTMALSGLEHTVHLVIHPQFDVERDVAGQLKSMAVPEDGKASTPPAGWLRESWMHVEIDRIGTSADLAELEEALQRALRDVREAVDDWPKLQQRLVDVVAELRDSPPKGVRGGRGFSGDGLPGLAG